MERFYQDEGARTTLLNSTQIETLLISSKEMKHLNTQSVGVNTCVLSAGSVPTQCAVQRGYTSAVLYDCVYVFLPQSPVCVCVRERTGSALCCV